MKPLSEYERAFLNGRPVDECGLKSFRAYESQGVWPEGFLTNSMTN